ncbi:MAG: hypothetical protein H0W25_03720 [Acidimicrobiia bacterium]|nr:hypothetical protein [Acidimicrobiia bacterium]
MTRTRSIATVTRRRLAAAALGVLLISASACGGDDGDASSATTADAATPTTADTSPTTTDAEPPTTTTTTDATPTTTTTGGDACDILSDDVVTAVLGVDIVRREPTTDGSSRSCLKGLDRTDDPANFFYVNVAVIPGAGSMLVDQFAAEPAAVPIEGLGDQAVYVPDVGGIFMVVGADAVQVQVVQGGVPGNQEDCVTVAEDVLANI